MTSGIYAFENKINGKMYVGQAVKLERRLREHEYYLKLGKDKCVQLQRAINKYGRENFDVYVLERCQPEFLNEREIHYIQAFDTTGRNGYNASKGGLSGLLGYKHSPEMGQKVSAAKKGWKMSEEQKENLSKMFKGKVVSKETREKISAGLSGENHYAFGKTISEETRERLRVAHGGKNAYQFGTKTPDAASKYFGVSRFVSKGRYVYWKATVKYKGERVYLGSSKDETEAARLYDAYVIENGLPNPLNFPQEAQ